MKQPRNVRPSFAEIQVDGRKSVIRTGPKAKDGRMIVTFYVRHKGKVERQYQIKFVPKDGKLIVDGESFVNANFNKCFFDSFDLD